MAKNTGRGTRGALGRAPNGDSLWTKRNPPAGTFERARANGGAFKGVRDESRPRLSNAAADLLVMAGVTVCVLVFIVAGAWLMTHG